MERKYVGLSDIVNDRIPNFGEEVSFESLRKIKIDNLKRLSYVIPSFVVDKILFSKIRNKFWDTGKVILISGGAHSDVDTNNALRAIFGVDSFYEGYGLTAFPVATLNCPTQFKSGTVGKPIAGTNVEVVDGVGNPLPVGEKGEIRVKGPQMMKGYWKKDQLTKFSIRDGWLYTGDIGMLDRDGYLIPLGQKHMIVPSKGENIDTRHIEKRILEEFPNLDYAFCVGYGQDSLGVICGYSPQEHWGGALYQKSRQLRLKGAIQDFITKTLRKDENIPENELPNSKKVWVIGEPQRDGITYELLGEERLDRYRIETVYSDTTSSSNKPYSFPLSQ